MEQMFDVVEGVQLEPVALLDIVLTAVLIYGVFSLIQGTRAVRLVIGAIILYLVFVLAQELNLVLLSGIMQTGVVVGLLALVVIFQPELRRGLDRLGRVGSWSWLRPSDGSSYQRIARTLAASAAELSSRRVGALIVVERQTGLGDMAETGVPIEAQLSSELLTSLFAPGYPLHDGAVIVSGDHIISAGAMLPLAERMSFKERYGTRHRAAVGATEQTDALAIVVSEETGGISLARGGGIIRDLDEEELRQRLYDLLSPPGLTGRAASTAPEDAEPEDQVTEAEHDTARIASVPAADGHAGTVPSAEAPAGSPGVSGSHE